MQPADYRHDQHNQQGANSSVRKLGLDLHQRSNQCPTRSRGSTTRRRACTRQKNISHNKEAGDSLISRTNILNNRLMFEDLL
ncbi:Hypothetical predicted protein [Scomber scombrus]|uniref:Uncharacterized protein n=1 Tax=Scomber scombrus TaxID=13677 RepID=A0AAV1Q264_SCOSC